MARELAERHSLAAAIGPSLVTSGWDIGTVKEGFKREATITVPTVSLYFLPSTYYEKELGHLTAEKSFLRRIQFDCYMESEDRAVAIRDDIADFLDGLYMNVTDPLNANVIGTMHVPDSETIRLDTMPPILSDPKVKRWRGIVQATLQSDYF